MPPKIITVVAAIIVHKRKILCVQRGPHKFPYISKKFEFPGGKVEEAESNEQALAREIQEELSLNIIIEKHFASVEHKYPDFSIMMHSYLCSCAGLQKLILTEHVDFKWLPVKNLASLDWAAADVPIVQQLQAESNAD